VERDARAHYDADVMTDAILQSALKLSKAQRILLVERIWDSIASQGVAPLFSEDQKAELARRMKRIRRTGPQGDEWAVVKKRIVEGTRK
jgi:putative addiction module component (TIGR02574 family)